MKRRKKKVKTPTNTKSKRSAYLASIIKGEPGEEDVREGLDNAEDSIHNPVGQPLCIILFKRAFNGLYTK